MPQQRTLAAAPNVELFLSVLCDFFEAQGLEKYNPSMLRRSHGYAAFKDKVEPLVVFFIRGMGSTPLTRAGLLAFFRLGITLLHRNMHEMNVSVSIRTVMNHTHRIPSVIEQSFPGYARNGLLGLIIRRKEKVHELSSHQ